MLARWTAYSLMLGVIGSVASIALASIFFNLALVGWIVDCVRSRRLKICIPRFGKWFALYAAGFTASVIASPMLFESALNLRKLFLFSLVFMIPAYLGRKQVRITLLWVFAALAASAFYGILQYFWLKDVTLLNRIDGFMSHWMTFSGQMMLGIVALSSLIFLYFRFQPLRPHLGRNFTSMVILGLLGLALLLTSTRNAWLGTGFSFFLLSLIYGYRSIGHAQEGRGRFSLFGLRWTAALLAGLLLAFVILPAGFQQRVLSSFDTSDFTTSGRLELMRTGLEIIRDQPLTGVGPQVIPYVFREYRTSDRFPDDLYQHLHNSYMQVAAESGIPTFVFWMCMWIALLIELARMARKATDDAPRFALTCAALLAVIAFLTGGLFEMNFGDSEVVILLLFLIASAYVFQQEPATSA